MAVVLVGVTILLLTAQLIIWRTAPGDIQTHLSDLNQTNDDQAIALVTADLLQTFQRAVLSSLLVAGLASIVAGLITSLLLTREILRPLDEIAQSSQRIANGHYGERVAVPYLNLYVGDGFVVVPTCGHPADDDMVALIAAQFPGREAFGLEIGSILAVGGGGIHCVTQQVPALPSA